MLTLNCYEYRILGKQEGEEGRPVIGQAFLEAEHVGGADEIWAGEFRLVRISIDSIQVELLDE